MDPTGPKDGLVDLHGIADHRQMPSLDIKEIRVDQIDAVVRMWRRSRDDVQPELEARMDHSGEDDNNFFRTVLMKTCEIWLALRDEQIVGLMAMKAESIEQLYIDPPEQACGVGSTFIDFAKQRSPDGLELYTHVSNSRARSFYENREFRAVAFGVSPPPESEPDVRYAWNPAPNATED